MNLKLDVTQGILGLGPGVIYALLGIGLIVVYRGSGVLNFAHGAMAMAGAMLYIDARQRYHFGFVAALLISVLSVAALGGGFHLVVMRRLRQASTMARTAATLGLFLVIQGGATVRWGTAPYFGVVQSLPHRFRQWNGYGISEDRVAMIVIAAVLTVGLWWIARKTLFGIATAAVAENEVAAETLGWSSNTIAAANWALGAGLAALAGVLFAPVSGIQVAETSSLVIPALAVSLIGGFRSFPLSLCAGLLLGFVAEAVRFEAGTRRWPTGLADSVPFLVIVLMLAVRGRALPMRDHVFDRPPALGAGTVRVATIGALGAVLVVLIHSVFGTSLVDATLVSLGVSIVLLSIVVLTGYTWQISLAQFAFAGFGALVTGQLVSGAHWPFLLALVAGTFACVPIGALFGLPAVRTRGVNLAVVTLGLSSAAYNLVFATRWAARGHDSLPIPPQRLFGISIDPVAQPRSYAYVVLFFFVLSASMVATLRRSRVGRRLISVRGNERAAAALGVNVVATKLYAFALSAAIAGLGGALLAFRSPFISFNDFAPFLSITYVANAVIGGIGFVIGPLFGQLFTSGSVGVVLGDWLRDHAAVPTILFGLGYVLGGSRFVRSVLADGRLDAMSKGRRVAGGIVRRVVLWAFLVWVFRDPGRRLVLFAGLTTLTILMADPNGIAYGNVQAAQLFRSWLRTRRGRPSVRVATPDAPVDTPIERVAPGRLEVRGVSVRFGGVVALDDVSIDVEPGQVVGLIGPNGAGKTTFIDAVTGFNQPASGSLVLNGLSLDDFSAHQRTRAGLSRSFQSLELFEELTVADNLRTACDRRDGAAYVTALVHPGTEPLTPAALAAVRTFRLGNHLDTRVDALPYGLRRLTAIARAVASAPSVLLLDEPAAGLGDTESGELATLVRGLADEWGMGVLLVEHDMNFVMSICDRVAVLDFGRKIADGTCAEVRADPRVIAAYLGEPDMADGQDPDLDSLVGARA